MSEDYIITRKEKAKDPRKVEQGKRLARRNKGVRAREKLELEESERSKQNES